ncbi:MULTISPECIES: hypothetical protein [Priestia]|uniref:Uncharacterized protein n=1 Tax=Priestia aryabhattai TaxID=412384 RepID=A0ABD5KMY9_PRIAR|nr:MULTISPECIES: hypothetical protein [Priestia]UPK48851.1 hypothetical protein MT476_19515 [Bacillus sp. H8-1]MCA1048859.1 hypothetical protein [Priestia aryabhattai]MDC7763240.1 hypothetical protein [Priestia aryabhattai]MEB4856436.1 hypothetical protein [Priestia megaterium]MEB4888415.1 hypothetical protein [Priestia megaterium]
MIGRQGEDSCGESGTGETPQERKQRGGSPAARGKRSLAGKSTAVSQAFFSLCIPFIGLSMSFLSLCVTLIFLYQFVKIMHMLF